MKGKDLGARAQVAQVDEPRLPASARLSLGLRVLPLDAVKFLIVTPARQCVGAQLGSFGAQLCLAFLSQPSQPLPIGLKSRD